MPAIFLVIFMSLLLSPCLMAQGTVPVDLSYQNKPLFEVLGELEKKHKLRFSYVQDKLELNKKINFYVRQKTLDQALKSLFDQHNIAYAQMGQQWVLKNAPKPEPKAVQRAVATVVPPQTEIIRDSVKKEPEPEKSLVLSNNTIEPLPVSDITLPTKNIALEQTIVQKLRSDVGMVFQSWKERSQNGDVRVFQFSTLGNRKKYSNKTNVISLSVFWGVHGASEGIQLAGMGSVVRRNVTGMQLSGAFNAAGKEVAGLQAAGILNSCREKMMGAQLSGVFNHADEVFGAQITPGINLSNAELKGIQIGGIGNIAGKSSNSAQIAGVFNVSAENSNFQFSGLYNKSKTVKGLQLSTGINETDELRGAQIGMVNRAKNVKGLQLGFINFADSVSGVSIGLLNIVKAGGYNKLEASFSESMHILIGLKIGSRSMYQIYQGGFNLKGKAWGLGWGLGSAFYLNRRWQINSEIVAMHINEDANWNPSLNLLSQLRVGFEYQLDRDFSLFLGPTANFMVSRYKEKETGIIGSSVPMYALYDHTNKKETNFRFWLGLQTGIRMRLW